MNVQYLKSSLLVTRFFVFAMMALWAWDRIADVGHAENIAARYYNIGPIEFSAIPHTLLGFALLVIYVLFLIGFKKKITYFIVFFIHFLGTAVTYNYSLPFFEEFRLTWFTGFPALMAMWILWVLRSEDTLLTVPEKWT